LRRTVDPIEQGASELHGCVDPPQAVGPHRKKRTPQHHGSRAVTAGGEGVGKSQSDLILSRRIVANRLQRRQGLARAASPNELLRLP
jgi:hypothetical protein